MPRILSRRGRPPHPDILTPAEWQVLEGVRAGRTNQEVADQLGITYHTVKYHISNMLGKQHLEDRQQLGSWRPPRPERTRHRPTWRALVSLTGLKLAAASMGVSLAIAGIAGVTLFAVYGLKPEDPGDDEPKAATARAAALPTPHDTIIVIPHGTPGVGLGVLERGRAHTRLRMSVQLDQALPAGVVPSAGNDLTIHAITQAGPIRVGDRERDYPPSGSARHWFIDITADPLPDETVAVQVTVDKITLMVRGTDPWPVILGPWTGVAFANNVFAGKDLTSSISQRIDTSFGWWYVIDGAELFGDALAITYHAEGDLDLLRPERLALPTSSNMVPYRGFHRETVAIDVPAGAASVTVRFGGARRVANDAAPPGSGVLESGDWTLTTPLN